MNKWEPCLEPAVDPKLPCLVLQLAEAGHELWLDGGQLARVVLALVDVLGQPQHSDVEQPGWRFNRIKKLPKIWTKKLPKMITV